MGNCIKSTTTVSGSRGNSSIASENGNESYGLMSPSKQTSSSNDDDDHRLATSSISTKERTNGGCHGLVDAEWLLGRAGGRAGERVSSRGVKVGRKTAANTQSIRVK